MGLVGHLEEPESRSCARTSTSGSTPSSTGRSKESGRISGSTHLPEGPRWWPHRLGRGDNRHGGESMVGARSSACGIGPSEAEPFWSGFLKGLVKRGLKGVKLVISDAHEGLRHAITRVLGATWQRCRVHWIRNALAYVPKGQQTMVAAAIRKPSCRPMPRQTEDFRSGQLARRVLTFGHVRQGGGKSGWGV